jgi:DNA processing protein
MSTNDAQLRLALSLFHCKGGHAPALSRALRDQGSLKALMETTREAQEQYDLSLSQQALLSGEPASAESLALGDKDLEWALDSDHHLVTYDSIFYPERLRETDCPPLLLYVRGSLATLGSLQLAIVGSRNASDYGKRNAYWMARELCKAGVTVCSGLALGVDASAHLGALDALDARDALDAAGSDASVSTVAVLGTGIDRVYPAAHRALFQRIADNGAVVSEFPLGMRAYAYNFPRRNRLISGLSVGVLVIEAAIKSGSLITARYAVEQNREVYALPSLLSNPQGRGCHELIKQGAMLVDDPNDILLELGLRACEPHETLSPTGFGNLIDTGEPNDLQPLQHKLLQRLRTEDCLFDSLLDADLASFGALNHALLDLEVRGLVSCRGGRYTIA